MPLCKGKSRLPALRLASARVFLLLGNNKINEWTPLALERFQFFHERASAHDTTSGLGCTLPKQSPYTYTIVEGRLN